MESALIVSHVEKNILFFTQMLNSIFVKQIVALQSVAQARRMISDKDFDLVLIDAPLRDETGESFARYIISTKATQPILIVQSELFDEMSSISENEGVLIISKPINKSIFLSTLKIAKSVQSRLKFMETENSKLKQKIEDIRIIDRAKCILISYLKITEKEAHRYIEKQAMDMRTSKRLISEAILRTYEN